MNRTDSRPVHLLIGVLMAAMLASSCRRPAARWEVTPAGRGYVARYTFEAMDTIYTVSLAGEGHWDTDRLDAMFRQCEAIVRDVERRMSYFRDDSEISRIHRRAGHWIRLSQDTWTVLRLSLDLAARTDGAFNPLWAALKPLYRLKDPAWTPPGEEEIRRALSHTSPSLLRLKEPDMAMLADPDARVDLGGVAKGYAVGRVSRYLERQNLLGFIVDGGGDIYVSGRRPDRMWRAAIRDPRGDGMLAVMDFTGGCLFTSGDYERYRVVDGRRYTHVVDPRTGHTVDHIISSTVVGSDPAVCDGLATALMVLKPAEIPRILGRFPGYEALVVMRSMKAYATPGLVRRLKNASFKLPLDTLGQSERRVSHPDVLNNAPFGLMNGLEHVAEHGLAAAETLQKKLNACLKVLSRGFASAGAACYPQGLNGLPEDRTHRGTCCRTCRTSHTPQCSTKGRAHGTQLTGC